MSWARARSSPPERSRSGSPGPRRRAWPCATPVGGRAVLVTLTDAGHALIERTVDHVLGREAHLVSGLTKRQRQALVELLDVLLADVSTRVASS